MSREFVKDDQHSGNVGEKKDKKKHYLPIKTKHIRFRMVEFRQLIQWIISHICSVKETMINCSFVMDYRASASIRLTLKRVVKMSSSFSFFVPGLSSPGTLKVLRIEMSWSQPN
jgi:hypothetical protein